MKTKVIIGSNVPEFEKKLEDYLENLGQKEIVSISYGPYTAITNPAFGTLGVIFSALVISKG